MNARMDGWMDEWTDGWMDGLLMDGQIEAPVSRLPVSMEQWTRIQQWTQKQTNCSRQAMYPLPFSSLGFPPLKDGNLLQQQVLVQLLPQNNTASCID